VRGLAALALALVLAAALPAAAALAQGRDSVVVPARPVFPVMDPNTGRVLPLRVDAGRPLLLHFTVEPPLSQRSLPPLPPAALARVRQARADREAGLLDRGAQAWSTSTARSRTIR